MDEKAIKLALISCELEFLENECHDLEYKTIIEVWCGKRKITIYCGETILLLRVWGPHIHDEMSEHNVGGLDEMTSHIEWLQENKPR